MILLSHFQASEILEALKQGRKEVITTSDLGKTKAKIELDKEKVIFYDEGKTEELSEKELNYIIKNDKVCFILREGNLNKIQLFSPETNKFYKLFPTSPNTAPTVEISGIRMHTIKDTNPWKDAKDKLSLIKPVKGIVLDTCMGLGYTAINAAKTADFIETFERDNNIIKIASYNPWSQELFNSNKIKINKGDIFKLINKLADNSFDRVIHDPPRFSLSGNLYSEEFYRQLCKVMKPTAKLFHYTGSPGKIGRGRDIIAGIIKRLNNAGFRNIKRRYNGLIAVK